MGEREERKKPRQARFFLSSLRSRTRPMMHGWWRGGRSERYYAAIDRQLRVAQHCQQRFTVDQFERLAGHELPRILGVIAARDDLHGGSTVEFHQVVHLAHVFHRDVAMLPMPALHQSGHAMLA